MPSYIHRKNYAFEKLCIDKIASLNELKTAEKVELEFCVSFTEGELFAIQMAAYLNIFEYKFKSSNRPFSVAGIRCTAAIECTLDQKQKNCRVKNGAAFVGATWLWAEHARKGTPSFRCKFLVISPF